MKHVFTSAGLLALGAVSLHAYDPQMTRQANGRPWSIAASIRGFYDDNINTAPSKTSQDSVGFEVTPSAHLNLPLEQTFISLGYAYTYRWYEDREPRKYDQAHELNGSLHHQFSPRHDLSVDDVFVITSEPTVADRFGIVTTPTKTRTDSDVTHNLGSIQDNIGLTQKIGLSLGYANSYYDYEQKGTGSRSALLDRIDQLFRADVRYQFKPTIVGLIGYTFGISTYTGDELISTPPPLKSDDRDSYSHYVYVGGDFDLTAKLRSSIRIGGQFTDYHNAGETSASPYVDNSISYVYSPGSAASLGIRHARSATDIVTPNKKGEPTLDAESTAIYAKVDHRITRNLTGSVYGQFQTSEFNGGQADGDTDEFYIVGVNLDYRFDRHFSGEIGYNFDLLNSDIHDRGYDRNRFYVGLRATY